MNKDYLFRAGIFALAVAVPGCLKVPAWHDPPDAGVKDTGSISDTTNSGDEPDTQNGLDARVGQDVLTGHDAGEDAGPGSDAQSDAHTDADARPGVDASDAQGGADAHDAGIIPQPFQLDQQCLVLLNFEQPAPLENRCRNETLVAEGDVQYRAGRFGQAGYFNGTSLLRKPGNITLDLDLVSITVEASIKPGRAQESYNGTFGNLVHSVYSNGQYEGFAFGINSDGLFFVAGLEGNRTMISTPTLFPTDRFTHVAATYDGNHLRLYVDGAQVSEQAAPGRLTRITDPSAVLTIGADRNGLNGFIGAMDEVRISSVARY